jgi:hypothetical protein
VTFGDPALTQARARRLARAGSYHRKSKASIDGGVIQDIRFELRAAFVRLFRLTIVDGATSVVGVRRAKAALSSGCKPNPATAPAGSNRSSHGGNEVAEAFDQGFTDWWQRECAGRNPMISDIPNPLSPPCWVTRADPLACGFVDRVLLD